MTDAVFLGIGTFTVVASAVALVSSWRDARYRRSPGWMRACWTGSALGTGAGGVIAILDGLGAPVVGWLALPATILGAVGITAVVLFGPRSTPAVGAASPGGSAPPPSAGPSVSPPGD